jgi:cytidine deaminase
MQDDSLTPFAPNGLLPEKIDTLRHAARAVAARAYAPYSHYHVGAAVLLANGSVVTGCNVENASYRLTVCAEQGAVARAVAEYGPKIQIVAVAVANEDATVPCQPCGACRQTIYEFATEDCAVFYPGDEGVEMQVALRDLLPASFKLGK